MWSHVPPSCGDHRWKSTSVAGRLPALAPRLAPVWLPKPLIRPSRWLQKCGLTASAADAVAEAGEQGAGSVELVADGAEARTDGPEVLLRAAAY